MLKFALFLSFCYFLTVYSQEQPHQQQQFFLSAAKNVPRIGRSVNRNGNADFEKFFLKASKSVPRIGRGNNNEEIQNINDADLLDAYLNYPNWNELLLNYPYGDMVSPNGWENEFSNNRYKRNFPKM